MWMKLDQNSENAKRGKLTQGELLKCPMCKGRGYFEPSLGTSSLRESEEQLTVEHENDNFVKLPQLRAKSGSKMGQKPRSKYCLPSINNVKNLPEHRPSEWSEVNEANSDFPSSKELQDKQNHLEEMSDPPSKKTEFGVRSETERLSQRLSVASSTDSNVEPSLIPSPKTPKNPEEILKTCLPRLKVNNWNESVGALKEIIQLCRFQPHILQPSMVIVYRGLIFLLKSFRSMVVRTACQASNELFATMANTQRPEFDEVVSILLQKTADTNKGVRQDANEALDTMVIYIAPNHSVRAIVSRGISHKSPLVRGASARLLVCVVGVAGVEAIFGGSKETRNRIVNAGASFMQDGNQEVRSFGRRLMKMLMKHEDFEDVLQAEVNEVILKRIEKILITMKYKT